MKFPLGLGVLLLCGSACVSAKSACTTALDSYNTDWINIQTACTMKMFEQIRSEINASYTYLEMGAYFSRDTVNRPAFSEFFFNAAKEEREHAIELMEYLTMRGELTNSITNLISISRIVPDVRIQWTGISALEAALELKTKITEQIRNVIYRCERGPHNDYHLVNYLTGVHLEEQYKGQRDIAGKISTLKKMVKTQGPLSESLYDWHFCVFNCEGSTFNYNPQK